MIELRPHHGMCIGQFVGKGYSKDFVDNMKYIIGKLESDNPYIKLVCHTDAICVRCPHNIDGICHSGQKVLYFDETCLRLCGLHEDEIIRWFDFKNIVKEMVLEKDILKEVCINCSWIELCIKNIGCNY
ncbi:MAG: DUF1284 domain-containing protein [Clostridiales bacterium]|nr:DUF1284 domain-containing protein [Clostridiales bacterium]